MRKWMNVVIGALLAFSVYFISVGYAAVSNRLDIIGRVEVEPQTGVFISDVDIPNGINAMENGRTGTVLNSTVTLGNSGNSTVSFDITVFNNSPYVYKFNGVKYLDEAYSNANIVFALTDLEKGDQITEYQTLNFTVTFSYKNGQVPSNHTLNSVLNFEFVPEDEYIAPVVVRNATDRFAEILNNAEDYDKLTTQMDDTSWGGRWSDSYIGNVVGATTTDTKVLEELFTDENGQSFLILDIGGNKTNITAMIKRENVDGESGNEMSIYMTAATIGRTDVQVFVSVFKQGSDGKWYQLGEMYEGEASTNNYSVLTFWAKDSFNTDSWLSTVDYYNLGTDATIEDIISAYKKTI